MENWNPRCFGHYKDSDSGCQHCSVYYECYVSLMKLLMNDPESPRIYIDDLTTSVKKLRRIK